MSCCGFKTRVNLEYPIEYENFVSYPVYCRSFGVLARYKVVRVIFPSIIESDKPISILTCTTNTPLLTEECELVTFDMIEPNRPYDIYFDEVIGGYVLVIPKCTCKNRKDKVLPLVVKKAEVEVIKEVVKKK